MWADYFDEQGIQYAFFSAANAVALQQARRDAAVALEKNVEHSGPEDEGEGTVRSRRPQSSSDGDDYEEHSEGDDDHASYTDSSDKDSDEDVYVSAEEDTTEGSDSRGRILSVLELESLFVTMAPDLASEHICSCHI